MENSNLIEKLYYGGKEERMKLLFPYINQFSTPNVKTLHAGTSNIIIPELMKDLLHYHERIIIGLSTGIIKTEFNSHPDGKEFLWDFYKLIRNLDEKSYKNIPEILNNIPKNPKLELERKKRLDTLSSKIKRKFVESFLTPYYPPMAFLSRNGKIEEICDRLT